MRGIIIVLLVLTMAAAAAASHRSIEIERISFLGGPTDDIQPVFLGVNDGNHLTAWVSIPELGIKGPERDIVKGNAITFLPVSDVAPGEYVVMIKVKDKRSGKQRRKFRFITLG
ncbi:MAG: hypothetical protein QF486_00425 [Candidatus Woesearchaeota archaeon]|jgi:hypothetical protein|nr:hypothetical protein [Candidatus Woesearchaeota archaeon]MDP7198069.1 hypothetical protein [Candidatus Woesearchaeota archaeon]MDP7466903.1 hypothetical protein [Candidatus Woesearchaeota archaeon]MDP7647338.1 hypothetical protein [Candidatus Woesearchaeota archaeon]|tara:strand:- start:38 stop:379 length:342 start_codon:yes stop_codon:yes gene_type:complete